MDFDPIDNEALPEDVVGVILSFLDVPTLVEKKAVCRSWRLLFTHTINQKAPTPKAFISHTKLRLTVAKYMQYNVVDAEEFATTYGWPIGRWDVSNIQDFNSLFASMKSFNEDIGA
eukprot:scaffold11190_cov32-Attheya_sp.AAC.5